MRATMALVIAGIVACATATAFAGASDQSHLSSHRSELSKKMAACAGRHEGLAKIASQAEQPGAAEQHRRGAELFRQCALHLRVIHDEQKPSELKDGETSIELGEPIVERDAEAAEQLLLSEIGRKRFDEVASLMGECRELDSQLRTCPEKRLGEEDPILKKYREIESNRSKAPTKPQDH